MNADDALTARADADPRRRAILDAGREAFLSEGYEGAQMVAVARAARVSTVTLYAAFGDKDTLLTAVVEDMFAAFEGELRAVELRSAEYGPRDRLYILASALVRLMSRREVRAMSRIIFSQARRLPHLSRAYYERGYSAAARRVHSYLGRLAADSALAIPARDLGLATRHAMALLMHGTLTLGLWAGDEAPTDYPPEVLATEAMDMIVARYAPPTPPEGAAPPPRPHTA